MSEQFVVESCVVLRFVSSLQLTPSSLGRSLCFTRFFFVCVTLSTEVELEDSDDDFEYEEVPVDSEDEEAGAAARKKGKPVGAGASARVKKRASGGGASSAFDDGDVEEEVSHEIDEEADVEEDFNALLQSIKKQGLRGEFFFFFLFDSSSWLPHSRVVGMVVSVSAHRGKAGAVENWEIDRGKECLFFVGVVEAASDTPTRSRRRFRSELSHQDVHVPHS